MKIKHGRDGISVFVVSRLSCCRETDQIFGFQSHCRKPSHADYVLQLNAEKLAKAERKIIGSIAKQ